MVADRILIDVLHGKVFLSLNLSFGFQSSSRVILNFLLF